jgi:hypothetical protein
LVGDEEAEISDIETINENMAVLEDCDLDNTIMPAVIFVSSKGFLEIEVVDADEIETIDENMAVLEDCDLDNTIMSTVIFVSSKVFLEIEVVDADRGAAEYVGRLLHKVITHLRIIAFESRRTHT